MSSHIPFDIQVQIFERLTVESLIRFRSVCKAWKSLIDCSEFIAGYSVPQTQPQRLLLKYKVGDWRTRVVKCVWFVDDDTFPQQKLPLTVPPLVQGSEIIGCSHGLFCLIGYFREPEDSSKTEMAVLWNPTIGRSIAIVVPNEVHSPFYSVVGFGVCPNTKDPKLVKITYIHDVTKIESISCIPCQVMVFALSSGEWRCLCSNQLPRKSIQFRDQFYSYAYQTTIGQFIYWLAYDRIAFNGQLRKHNLIMSFDLSTDEFGEVNIPDRLREAYFSISRLRESLVLFEYETRKKVCVWMMDHGDSKAFTKSFTINVPNASVERTVTFRKSGEPIIQMQEDVGIGLTSALAVYEPCSEEIKDLGICGNTYSFRGSSYTESLLLMDHDDGRIIRC